MFVEKKGKNKNSYSGGEKGLLLLMAGLYLSSLGLMYYGRLTQSYLLPVGGGLFILATVTSAFIGFAKQIIYYPSFIYPIRKGKSAVTWAWVHLLIGILFIAAIFLGVFSKLGNY